MAQASASAETLRARHYGMDWLRIGAFALLILYHVGLVFSPWPYELKAVRPVEGITLPLLLLNAWRLSLLFAISGYASAAVFERAGGPLPFLRGRLLRIGIPLAFGMAVVTAPQPWIWLTMAGDYRQSFLHFMVHDYFTFRVIDGIGVPAWMHLWFVAYLLAYTVLLGVLGMAPARWRVRVRSACERVLAGPLLLPVGIAWVYVARLLPNGWSDAHDLLHDPAAHAAYLPMFLFGAALRASERLRRAIARQWKLAACAALVGYGFVAARELHALGLPLPGRPGHQTYLVARAVQSWATIVALFGLADCHWNRDARWRATLAEAVFPFYIAHQTVLFVTGYWLRPLRLAPGIEFVALTLATAAGSALFYFAGRKIGPLRPLIGLKRRIAAPQAPVEPPPGGDPSAAPA